jgi:Flp pilus assembly protein TadG
MLKKKFAALRHPRQRGMATMLTAISLLFMIPVVGLSIDGGLAFVIKGRLSAAMDSASLAAARGLNLGSDIAAAQASALAAATQFFNANFPPGYMNTSLIGRVITPGFNLQLDANGHPTGVLIVSTTATVNMPTYFMRWLGFNGIPVTATGTATRRSLVMSLLLDKSASMGVRDSQVGTIPASIDNTSSSCEAMVYSAAQFVQNFTPYDSIGLVTFDYTAHNDYAPSTNFKQSGPTGITQSIANIQCGNNTNTTAALELGYRQITGVSQKLGENVIVLFTDGVPNAVNAKFPVRTQVDTRLGPSGTVPNPPDVPAGNNANCLDGTGTKTCVGMPACTNTAGFVTGVISQQAGFSLSSGGRDGLYKMFNTDSTPTSVAGCPASASMQLVNQVIAYIPDSDFFSNSTHGPWDGWLYQVNQQCAPIGTQITVGNSRCKNLGDLWSNHSTLGAGAPSNFFQNGPYQGKFRPDIVNTIGVVSMNSATNEANKIRSDTTYNITIDTVYLQGNGSDPVDRSFLQIVSNQPTIQPLIYDSTDAPYTNQYFQANQQQGMWLATTSQVQLTALFAQVASSLLRISQ